MQKKQIKSLNANQTGAVKIWVLVLVISILFITILSFLGIGIWMYLQTTKLSSTNLETDYEYGSARTAVGSSDSSYDFKTAVPDVAATASTNDVLPEKIIKTGNLSLSVAETEKAITSISAAVKDYSGFVQNSRTYETKNERTAGEMTIRIPVASFEEALIAIKAQAKVVISEALAGQDVTEEYIDLEARLKNKQETEARYTEILAKANSVEDILKVTNALENTRAEVESLQGQLKYLANKTDLATISVSLTEETNVIATTKTWEPLENARQAFQTWIIFLQKLADLLVWLIIFLLPPTVIIYLMVRVIIYIYRRKQHKGS